GRRAPQSRRQRSVGAPRTAVACAERPAESGATMKQVVQTVRGGATRVIDVPDPLAHPGHVLVANVVSLISAGTERHVVELAQKSLLAKAKSRPDHVRRVIEKVRVEGIASVA